MQLTNSKLELRRYAMSVYDKEGKGSISEDELLELLTMLHPHNQGPVTVSV